MQAVIDRQDNRQILRVFDPQERAWHEAAVTPPGNIGTANDLYFGKDVARFEDRVPGAPQHVVRLVVGEEEHDIGPGRLILTGCETRRMV